MFLSRIRFNKEMFSRVSRMPLQMTHRYNPLHPRLSDREGNAPFAASRYSFFWAMNTFGRIFKPDFIRHTFPAVPLFRGIPEKRAKFVIDDGNVWYCYNTILYKYCTVNPEPQIEFMIDLKTIEGIEDDDVVQCFNVSGLFLMVQLGGKLIILDKNNPEIIIHTIQLKNEHTDRVCTMYSSTINDNNHSIFIGTSSHGHVQYMILYHHNTKQSKILSLTDDDDDVSTNDPLRCSYITEDMSHWVQLKGNKVTVYKLISQENLISNIIVSSSSSEQQQQQPAMCHLLRDCYTCISETAIGPDSLDSLFLRLALIDRKTPTQSSNAHPIVVITKTNSFAGITSSLLHLADDNASGDNQVLTWSPNEGVITGLGIKGDICLVGISSRHEDLIFQFSFSESVQKLELKEMSHHVGRYSNHTM